MILNFIQQLGYIVVGYKQKKFYFNKYINFQKTLIHNKIEAFQRSTSTLIQENKMLLYNCSAYLIESIYIKYHQIKTSLPNYTDNIKNVSICKIF